MEGLLWLGSRLINLYVLIDLTLLTTLEGRNCYNFPLKDEETLKMRHLKVKVTTQNYIATIWRTKIKSRKCDSKGSNFDNDIKTSALDQNISQSFLSLLLHISKLYQ